MHFTSIAKSLCLAQFYQFNLAKVFILKPNRYKIMNIGITNFYGLKSIQRLSQEVPTHPYPNILNMFYSFLKNIPISSKKYIVSGRRPRTIYSNGIWYYLQKLQNIPWTVLKSKIYCSKLASYRFYSLSTSILYSLFKDVHLNLS